MAETAFNGILHNYYSNLVAFEFHPELKSDKVVVFVGGLGDGLLTVPYVPALADKLASAGWSLIQALISSSYKGFGTGSLERDAKELGELVKYLRTDHRAGKKRTTIVLAGHSTGTQNVVQYLTKFLPLQSDQDSYDIQAGILQAPASDRDAVSLFLPPDKLQALHDEVHALVDQNKETYPDKQFLLPSKFSEIWFDTPITAYRWLSLSAKGGDDDFFSEDLDNEAHAKTFGKITKPLLIAISGKDEFMPPRIDKSKLLQRWHTYLAPEFQSKQSGVVEGASHNVGPSSASGAQEDFINRVVSFVQEL